MNRGRALWGDAPRRSLGRPLGTVRFHPGDDASMAIAGDGEDPVPWTRGVLRVVETARRGAPGNPPGSSKRQQEVLPGDGSTGDRPTRPARPGWCPGGAEAFLRWTEEPTSAGDAARRHTGDGGEIASGRAGVGRRGPMASANALAAVACNGDLVPRPRNEIARPMRPARSKQTPQRRSRTVGIFPHVR